MSNYNSLKTTIDANIKQNGRQEITGQILNSVLNQMVTTLGAEYQFAGVATIDTNPGSPDAKVFYIANGKGTYTNFGGVEVTEDDVVVLYWDSSWHKVSTGIASQAKLSELGQKVDGVALVDYTVTKGQQYTSDGYTTWNRYSCSGQIPAGTYNFQCPQELYFCVYKYISDTKGEVVFSYGNDARQNKYIDSPWIISVKKVNGTELSTTDIDTINNAGIVTKVTGDSINTMRYKINSLDGRIDSLEDFVNDNKSGNFLCLGDSLTFGVGVINNQTPTESENTYPKQMEKILGGKSYNGGVGGSSMTDNGSADFPMVVDALTSGDYTKLNAMLDSLTGVNTLAKIRWLEIESLNIADLDFIAIAFGINDWTIGAGINAVCDALQTGINKLRQAFPGVKLYVFTPTYAYKLGYGLSFDTDNYTSGALYLDEYCDAIEQKCNELNVPVKNMYYCSNIKSNNALSYYVDGKHRNANGYKLLAKQYAGFIRNN